jgi:predicted AlkP superfamily phosphohydrolase/phosphomutase
MPKVLAINLDGYEESLGRELMLAGQMPHLARLAGRSGRFFLDHGSDLRTGLAGEHFATGLSPELARRWAAVHFDKDSYTAWQEGTSLTPFPAQLKARTVVVDPSYFDLDRAPRVQGIVNWGAHDPGVASSSHPDSILAEARERFGDYPARDWIYGAPWSSEDLSREMGDRLAESVRVRTEIALWLLAERLPEWDLGIVTVSEAHSAIEGLWHGVDSSHPLHGVPSSRAAGAGVREVYVEIDNLIGRLDAAFPEAAKVVFSMHGMGPNTGDVATMLLLPELMYRHAFGRSSFRREGSSAPGLNGCPMLAEGETWDSWIPAGIEDQQHSILWQIGAKVLPERLKRILRPALAESPQHDGGTTSHSLDWMPAARYQHYWHKMPAFALPSFYDGRIRINLKGRERHGIVEPDDYQKTCESLVALLNRCTDPVTGEKVVGDVELPNRTDPAKLGPTEADIVFVWHGATLGFDHPELGRIGPAPYRRTGGHTGKQGFAFVEAGGMTPGDYGMRSAYDVVPTLFQLLGETPSGVLSGTTLLPVQHIAGVRPADPE